MPPVGGIVYKAQLAAAGAGASTLTEAKPVLARWTTWAAVGGGVVVVGAAAAIVVVATAPEAPPSGDVVVPLP